MRSILLSLLFIVIALGEIRAQEEDCFITPSKKVIKSFDQAYDLVYRRSYQSAISILNDIVEEEPFYGEARLLLGRAYFEREQYDKSEQVFADLKQECEAFSAEPSYYLGIIYYFNENFDSAASQFQSYLDEGSGSTAKLAEATELLAQSKFFAEMLSDPVPFDPQPVNDICSEFDEYLPIISPDESIMLFTRGSYVSDKRGYGSDKVRVEEFSISERQNGIFEMGAALPKPFNLGLREGGASISVDNNNIFVTICNAPDGYGSCDIYETEFKDGYWSDLRNCGPNINDSMWQSQVSLSADKKILYFSSNREGGFGGTDIWMSRKDSNGHWATAVNMGPLINTAGDDESPFIHPDDNTLYFSSTGHPGFGGQDIFFCRRDKFGGWMAPKNIGYPINTEYDDIGFFVSTSGKEAYFASNTLKGEGGWDIFGFPLYEGARPKKLLFMKGQIVDENGEVLKDVTIELKDLVTNEIKSIDVDSVSGKYIINELFENDQLMVVNKDGYFYGAQVLKRDDQSLSGPTQLDYKLQQLKVGSSYKINNILFDTDSYIIKERSKLELEGLVRFMELNENIRIQISGHTDNVGDETSNQQLSHNRAKAVKEFLVTKGITASRLTYKGYGELKPKFSNETDEGRSKNRRTEIMILGQ